MIFKKILEKTGYDVWHGIIPALVLTVSVPLIFLSLEIEFAYHVLLETILVLIALQFMNEWFQATDPYVNLKYGDWIGFQNNSRRDTKFFIIGMFMGLFMGFLAYGIIYNVKQDKPVVIKQKINYKTPEPATLPPPSNLPEEQL